MATINPLTSPALSSASSYDLVSHRSRSGSTISQSLRLNSDDSDDEIVWTVSDDLGSSSGSSMSESDFVLLSHPAYAARSMTGHSTPDAETQAPETLLATQSLEAQMAALSLATQTSKRAAKKAKAGGNSGAGTPLATKPKKKKTKKNATPSSAPATVPPKKAKPAQENRLVKFTGLGARPIVDDFSDRQSIISYDNESVSDTPTLYEEAATFISSFLSNPDAKNDSVYRLTLLQSIIIELGLATASLPSTLTAAKAFLKSRVFLNIREYIAVREQGPEAVQRAMYPSKTALIKDIRKNPTSIKWVKKHGLQVLLVGWMQH